MSLIYVRRVPAYDPDLLEQTIEDLFATLSVDAVLAPGMKVLIKPNLLAAREPARAVTTHPALIRAVANRLRARGITDIVLADSPGGPYTSAALKHIYHVCGLNPLSDVLTLNQSVDAREVPAAPYSSASSFQIIEPILDADFVINIAKMKTHGMTTASLSVKNLFGAIPGLLKPRLHFENPSQSAFANMLVSLAATIPPGLCIVDGILAMEGNGPANGIPRDAQRILASKDPFALDYVACQIMGLDPQSVPTVASSLRHGLLVPQDVRTVGDSCAPLDPPFTISDAHRLDFLSHAPAFLRTPLTRISDRFLRPFPALSPERCIKCGKCAESCPQNCIHFSPKEKPIFRLNSCINCLCCQEMCPVNAIRVRRSLIPR